MSLALRHADLPVTLRALFRNLGQDVTHISWVSSHPAVVVDDHGDGTADVGPADPSVATDAQVFAVAHLADGSTKSSAPFGVQVGHDAGVGSVVIDHDPNVTTIAPAADVTSPPSEAEAAGSSLDNLETPAHGAGFGGAPPPAEEDDNTV